MTRAVDAIFFLPFCESDYEMLLDTIRSIQYHVAEPHHIIAVDDCTPSRLDERLRREMPGITVLRNPRKHGGRSGLYVTQAAAATHALAHFDFKLFIKMDTDALMVGPGLVSSAVQRFAARPELGILGAYTVRADGHRRHWRWWKWAFRYESSPLRWLFGKPRLWDKPLRAARPHGYDLGENVAGGCYLINAACLRAMKAQGYLDYKPEAILAHSVIGDEIIYSLLCKAVGYGIGEFGTAADPMVIALDHVPMPVEQITAQRKAVIHSIKRGFRNESQQALRDYFRAHRSERA